MPSLSCCFFFSPSVLLPLIPPFSIYSCPLLPFALLLLSLLCTPSTAVWPRPGLFVVARLFCDYRLVVRNVNMMSMEVPLSLEWSTMASIRLMCTVDTLTQHQTVQTHWHLGCFCFQIWLWALAVAACNHRKILKISCIFSCILHIAVWYCVLMLVLVFPESKQLCLISFSSSPFRAEGLFLQPLQSHTGRNSSLKKQTPLTVISRHRSQKTR